MAVRLRPAGLGVRGAVVASYSAGGKSSATGPTASDYRE